MGYVAVKGGQDAIENASKLVDYFRWKGRTKPIELDQARTQMRLAVDRAMGEGSLYAPEHAALALLQVEGDSFEAAFHLRAYRATLERRYFAAVLNTGEMAVHRRISSTFPEIPGGQILCPTRDFSFRLLKPALLNATLGSIEKFIANLREEIDPSKLRAMTTYRKVIDIFLQEGLMSRQSRSDEDHRVFDVTREAIKFPLPRSGTLQMLARAETGALMCMAYRIMRGFGDSHGTVGELRVGDVPIRIVDKRGRLRYVGKIKVTEAEMVDSDNGASKSAGPKFSVGYGLIDEFTKKEIRRKTLKAVCIPGYQVPYSSPEMPISCGWGTGGLHLTLSLVGPDDVVKVTDQGSDASVNACNLRLFIKQMARCSVTFDTAENILLEAGADFIAEDLASCNLVLSKIEQGLVCGN